MTNIAIVDVLFVLQNAWRCSAPEDGAMEWKHSHWEMALWESHTGRRLREYIPDGVTYAVCNASPRVGNRSRSAFSPELDYVANWISRYEPRVVVLCGRLPQQLAPHIGRPVVLAPHPAWRSLSKAVSSAVRADLAGRFT